ncbi:hypothetical protein V6R21_10410 [Limibacter armeniacum]|uniref:hypothetical protein n=1 Tax=Limibacter armeniacum TaxID=466084 RepID=UPI002FE5BA72
MENYKNNLILFILLLFAYIAPPLNSAKAQDLRALELAVSPLGLTYSPFIATDRNLSQSIALFYNISKRFSLGLRFQNNTFNDLYTIKQYSNLTFTPDQNFDAGAAFLDFSFDENIEYNVESYSLILRYHFTKLQRFNPYFGIAVSFNHRFTQIEEFGDASDLGTDERVRSLSEATIGYNTGNRNPQFFDEEIHETDFLIQKHNTSVGFVAGLNWNLSRTFAIEFQTMVIDLFNRVTLPNAQETIFVLKTGPDAQGFAERLTFLNPREDRLFKDPDNNRVIAYFGSSSGSPNTAPIIYFEVSFIIKAFYKK